MAVPSALPSGAYKVALALGLQVQLPCRYISAELCTIAPSVSRYGEKMVVAKYETVEDSGERGKSSTEVTRVKAELRIGQIFKTHPVLRIPFAGLFTFPVKVQDDPF